MYICIYYNVISGNYNIIYANCKLFWIFYYSITIIINMWNMFLYVLHILDMNAQHHSSYSPSQMRTYISTNNENKSNMLSS